MLHPPLAMGYRPLCLGPPVCGGAHSSQGWCRAAEEPHAAAPWAPSGRVPPPHPPLQLGASSIGGHHVICAADSTEIGISQHISDQGPPEAATPPLRTAAQCRGECLKALHGAPAVAGVRGPPAGIMWRVADAAGAHWGGWVMSCSHCHRQPCAPDTPAVCFQPLASARRWPAAQAYAGLLPTRSAPSSALHLWALWRGLSSAAGDVARTRRHTAEVIERIRCGWHGRFRKAGSTVLLAGKTTCRAALVQWPQEG